MLFLVESRTDITPQKPLSFAHLTTVLSQIRTMICESIKYHSLEVKSREWFFRVHVLEGRDHVTTKLHYIRWLEQRS